MMKENIKGDQILNDIKERSKTLVLDFFGKKIAITHGDEKSMSGWECSNDNLKLESRKKELDSWFEENGKWYYIEENGTMSRNEWIIVNGQWFYANADGRISQNEWVLVNGNWYFANASGRIADSEWFMVGGKWYYAEKGGLIAQGKTLKINNVNYTFDSNGVLVK
mgnify:CR=1 FL=1